VNTADTLDRSARGSFEAREDVVCATTRLVVEARRGTRTARLTPSGEALAFFYQPDELAEVAHRPQAAPRRRAMVGARKGLDELKGPLWRLGIGISVLIIAFGVGLVEAHHTQRRARPDVCQDRLPCGVKA
jgi:hypothetical protein